MALNRKVKKRLKPKTFMFNYTYVFSIQEQEKSDALNRRLEGEQRAAKRIGQDITKYVQDMKQLEQQVQTHVKEKTILEEKLGIDFRLKLDIKVFCS